MTAPNVVVKYQIDGDSRVHIKGAVRIKVDGCGALTLYGAQDGKTESVSLDCIRSLSIHTMPDLSACPTATIQ